MSYPYHAAYHAFITFYIVRWRKQFSASIPLSVIILVPNKCCMFAPDVVLVVQPTLVEHALISIAWPLLFLICREAFDPPGNFSFIVGSSGDKRCWEGTFDLENVKRRDSCNAAWRIAAVVKISSMVFPVVFHSYSGHIWRKKTKALRNRDISR